MADEETYERWLQGIKGYWQYLGFFGFAGGLPDIDDRHPIEQLRDLDPQVFTDENLYVAGDADDIIDRLSYISETLGGESIAFDIAFESVGITGDEADTQLEAFADRVMPYFDDS